MFVQDLKERLLDADIESYQWVLTGLMWADVLTKEMEMYKDMQEHLVEGNFSLKNEDVNKVQCIDREIRMMNVQNRERQVNKRKRRRCNMIESFWLW